MIIYGWRSTAVATNHISSECPQCSTRGQMTMHIMQRYVHIFWIPLFPIGKYGTTYCSYCRSTLKKKHFTPEIKIEYAALKQQAKTPLWNFTGLIIIGLTSCIVTALVVFGFMREDANTTGLLANPEVGDIYEVKAAEKKYTLLKVTAIKGDSVYVCLNDFVCPTAAGFDDLMVKPFDKKSFGISKKGLEKMLTRETIMNVRRQ